MADHGVSFTRHDLFLCLTGEGRPLLDYLYNAIAEEVEDKSLVLPMHTRMMNNPDCFFHIPDYLAKSLALSGKGKSYRGIELVSWSRELIVAHVSLKNTVSPGQKAYEAFMSTEGGKKTVHHKDTAVTWSQLPDHQHEAWEEAAKATRA